MAVVGLIAGAAACNSDSSNSGGGSASGSNCGYELAYFGALTGSSANLGVNIEQGFELAIDQYNEKNGAGCITVEEVRLAGCARRSLPVSPGSW